MENLRCVMLSHIFPMTMLTFVVPFICGAIYGKTGALDNTMRDSITYEIHKTHALGF